MPTNSEQISSWVGLVIRSSYEIAAEKEQVSEEHSSILIMMVMAVVVAVVVVAVVVRGYDDAFRK